MRYFADTEFLEEGPYLPLSFLSIGVVCEDGRELYRQNIHFDFEHAAYSNPWLVGNVYPKLGHFGQHDVNDPFRERYPQASRMMLWGRSCKLGLATPLQPWECDDKPCPWSDRPKIAAELTEFCDPKRYGKPEFWLYYGDYDWVVICQLFGKMIDLPDGWPMYGRDIKQLCDSLGNPRLPEQTGGHNALGDARWNMEAYKFLTAGRTQTTL